MATDDEAELWNTLGELVDTLMDEIDPITMTKPCVVGLRRACSVLEGPYLGYLERLGGDGD